TLDRERRSGFLAALVFSTLSLLQASHRSNWNHVRDVLPTILLLLACLVWGRSTARTPGGRPDHPLGRFASYGLAIVGLTLLVGLGLYDPATMTPAAVLRKVAVFRLPRPEMLRRVRASSPDDPTLA